jgi:mono/diheme cytochrome c family protein
VSPTIIAVGILAIAGIVVVAFLAMSASRQRRAVEDVPPALRPGYSDEQLETTVLERYMAWGVVMTLFFAAFFPLYWWRESSRLNAEQETFFVASVVNGGELYALNCAECHGTNATGAPVPSPYDDGTWPAPNLIDMAARYAENRNITDLRVFVEQTLRQGRPGTPMPAWGVAFGGPLTDQAIEDITDWILANQVDEVAEATSASGQSGEELFTENCARCHGPDLLGTDEGRPAPPLIGVFQRHRETSILGILRNGIKVPTGTVMPPWQNGYQHTPYTDEALQRIIDYLRERQPAELLPDEEPDDEPTPEATEA